MSGWLQTGDRETQHVIPLGDEAEHIVSPECICGPRIDLLPSENWLIVHNAFDGRELREAENA